MLIKALTHFLPFRELSSDALKTVAQHTQVITMPAARWLLRAPRLLSGAFYLQVGRVQADGVAIAAHDQRARQAIIPGSANVRTLSTVQLLRVNTQPIEFLLETTATSFSLVEELPRDDWLQRFLGSRVMQQLNPSGWQQVLVSLEALPVTAGELVIRQGEVGAHFYVVRSGALEVFDQVRHLAVLEVGDFCGEDALISGGPRNASVRALTDCTLMALHKCAFQKLLQDSVVRFVGGSSGAIVAVDDPGTCAQAFIHLANLREQCQQLDRQLSWLVAAKTRDRAALGAFILTHQGYDAAVLCEAPRRELSDLLPIDEVD